MTLFLNGQGLLLEGSNPKIKVKQVPGISADPVVLGGARPSRAAVARVSFWLVLLGFRTQRSTCLGAQFWLGWALL